MASSPSAVIDDEAEIYGHRDQHKCEPDSDETRVAGSCDSSCTEDAHSSGGSSESAIRVQAPFFLSSGCGSSPIIVIDS